MRKYFIPVSAIVLALFVGGVLIFNFQSLKTSFAKTTLKLIQQKEDTSKPLKKFMYTGESLDFDAIIDGRASGAEGSSWTWSVSPSANSTIAADGTITPSKVGNLTVTLKYKSGSNTATASHTITVKKKGTAVSVSAAPATFLVGSYSNLTATVSPADTTDRANGVTWVSSNTNIVTVDAAGKITAKSRGTATITATFTNKAVLDSRRGASHDEYIKGTRSVIVQNIVPTGIEMDEVMGVNISESRQIVYHIMPANATVKTVSWQISDQSIATIDSLGNVTGVSKGAVTVTCTAIDGGVFATAEINVSDIDINAITLDVSEKLIYVGETSNVRAAHSPGVVTWEIGGTGTASISPISGDANKNEICNITGISKGDVLLTASAVNEDGLTTAACRIKVREIPVTDLEISDEEKTLYVGDEWTLGANVIPSDATNQEIIFESLNEEVATVDASGKITAKKSNVDKETDEIIEDCYVYARIETEDEYDEAQTKTYSKQCKLTIKNVAPTSLTLNKTELEIGINDEPEQLIASMLPANTTFKDVIWQSDIEEIATVSDDGFIDPVASGVTNISVVSEYDESIFATCEVTVLAAYSDEIVVKEDSFVIGFLDSEYIQVLSAPGKVTFESEDVLIAEVNENGLIYGAAKGLVNIVLSSFNESTGHTVTKVCHVRVKKYVESITFDKEEWVMNSPSGTLPIIATVLAEDADDRSLVWTSSNESVAVVNEDGLVTPIGYGWSIITATAADGSGVSASMEVDVAIPVSGIKLKNNERRKTLFIDGIKRDSVSIEAVILPDIASRREVKWKVSGAGILIEQSGEFNQFCKITARNNCEDVEVIASDYREQKTVSFFVSVKTKVTAIQIELVPMLGYTDGNPLELGNTREHHIKFKAKLFPAEASEIPITWVSLNSAVKVDENGNVTIPKNVAMGNYDIRAIANDGDITATKRIVMRQGIIALMLVPVDENLPLYKRTGIIEGDCLYMKLDIFPITAFNKEITVASSDHEIATVFYDKKTGLIGIEAEVMAYELERSSTITISTNDGSGIVLTYEVYVLPEPC